MNNTTFDNWLSASQKAWSFSSIKALLVSPLAFVRYKNADRVTTNAQRAGTALHAFILENETFYDRYLVINELKLNWATSEGKAQKQQWIDMACKMFENDSSVLEYLTNQKSTCNMSIGLKEYTDTIELFKSIQKELNTQNVKLQKIDEKCSISNLKRIELEEAKSLEKENIKYDALIESYREQDKIVQELKIQLEAIGIQSIELCAKMSRTIIDALEIERKPLEAEILAKIISQEDYSEMISIRYAMCCDTITECNWLINAQGQSEVDFNFILNFQHEKRNQDGSFEYPIMTFPIRGKIDRVLESGEVIDLKRIQDLKRACHSRWGVQNKLRELHYTLQGLIYTMHQFGVTSFEEIEKCFNGKYYILATDGEEFYCYTMTKEDFEDAAQVLKKALNAAVELLAGDIIDWNASLNFWDVKQELVY
jgi:hypothetical protein